jgi:hypothetical protein
VVSVADPYGRTLGFLDREFLAIRVNFPLVLYDAVYRDKVSIR